MGRTAVGGCEWGVSGCGCGKLTAQLVGSLHERLGSKEAGDKVVLVFVPDLVKVDERDAVVELVQVEEAVAVCIHNNKEIAVASEHFIRGDAELEVRELYRNVHVQVGLQQTRGGA